MLAKVFTKENFGKVVWKLKNTDGPLELKNSSITFLCGVKKTLIIILLKSEKISRIKNALFLFIHMENFISY